MLIGTKLKAPKPQGKVYNVADRDGMYAAVTVAGRVSFRYDYRIHGRRETIVLCTYDSTIGAKAARDVDKVDFRHGSLPWEARTLLARVRRMVERGEWPARAKSTRRAAAATELTFGAWTEKYFAEVPLAESTEVMRRSVYDRNLAQQFGRLRLEEVTPARLTARCEEIKARGAAAPAPALHAREIVMQV